MEGLGGALPDNSTSLATWFVKIGTPGEDWITGDDIKMIASRFATLRTVPKEAVAPPMVYKPVVDPLDIVVQRSLPAHLDDEMELATLAQRSFKGASIPNNYPFDMIRANLIYRASEKRKGTLAGSVDIIHRSYSSRSFVWVVPAIVAWPPSLVCGIEPQCSALWSVAVNLDKEAEGTILGALATALSDNYNGYFFRAVSIIFPTQLI